MLDKNSFDTPISEIVKDVTWQNVRKSLVGQWRDKKSWAISKLKSFLGNISATTPLYKLRIVGNYLVSTGFRTGRIKSPEIQALRTLVFKELRNRRVEYTKSKRSK